MLAHNLVVDGQVGVGIEQDYNCNPGSVPFEGSGGKHFIIYVIISPVS